MKIREGEHPRVSLGFNFRALWFRFELKEKEIVKEEIFHYQFCELAPLSWEGNSYHSYHSVKEFKDRDFITFNRNLSFI